MLNLGRAQLLLVLRTNHGQWRRWTRHRSASRVDRVASGSFHDFSVLPLMLGRQPPGRELTLPPTLHPVIPRASPTSCTGNSFGNGPAAIIPLAFCAHRSDESSCMKTTNKNDKQTATKGFAIELTESTQLGLAMLIAEDEEGQYEPVAVVASIGEAREIAESDLRGRMRRLERGEDPGLCPYEYKVWANGIDGYYRIAAELPSASIPTGR